MVKKSLIWYDRESVLVRPTMSISLPKKFLKKKLENYTQVQSIYLIQSTILGGVLWEIGSQTVHLAA